MVSWRTIKKLWPSMLRTMPFKVTACPGVSSLLREELSCEPRLAYWNDVVPSISRFTPAGTLGACSVTTSLIVPENEISLAESQRCKAGELPAGAVCADAGLVEPPASTSTDAPIVQRMTSLSFTMILLKLGHLRLRGFNQVDDRIARA